MPSRIGRIIISTSSPTDGESSDGLENGDDDSRTSSHRRRNMRRSANRSRPDEEINDQSQVLISALNQLHRLATLDSTEYQQRLLENTLPAIQAEQTEKSNSLYCPSLAKSSTRTQISEISQRIQTPLVQLSMSIHRLHAAVANITKEVDGHTDEVQELQSQITVLRRRNQQVEAAAKKVHKKNLKLKQQVRHDRKVAHELQHKVHKYEAQLESQGFQLMASKVQNHEIQLQLSKTQNSNNEGEDDRGQPRERTDSSISEFLDLEHESQDDNYSESVQTIGDDSTIEQNSSENEKVGSFVNIRSDSSEKSCCEKLSKPHRGFNDTMPTFRFSKDGIFKPGSENNSSSEKGSTTDSTMTKSDIDEPNICENDSPQKAKKKQQIGDSGVVDTGSNLASNLNRFAKFLGSRAISNYNLKIVPPCNIQFVELPLNKPMKENKNEKRSLGNTEVVEDHGIVQINDTSTRSLSDGVSPDSGKSPCAFVVCGLNGFNSQINMKPTIGAQLTKINGNAVDEEWTLDTLYNELEQESGTKNNAKQITLTFRNETWDNAQIRVINEAIVRVKRSGASARSSDDGGKEKTDGASLFESHQRTNSLDAPQSDGEITNDPPQRARTASADSMGKAINGIGNFLQKLNHVEG
jgi:predicted  nucleic acid-binding Zn-ribbon protein